MNDLERKIKVMQAFADGKPIQCRLRIRRDGEWSSCNAPLWDWHQWDYRVKPDDNLYVWEKVDGVRENGDPCIVRRFYHPVHETNGEVELLRNTGWVKVAYRKTGG